MSLFYDEQINNQKFLQNQYKLSQTQKKIIPNFNFDKFKYKTPKTNQFEKIKNKLIITGDRFIPLKNDKENFQNFLLKTSKNDSKNIINELEYCCPQKTKETLNYSNLILNSLLINCEDYSINKINTSINDTININKSILSFTQKNKNIHSRPYINSIQSFFQNEHFLLKKTQKRIISNKPEHILDAPNLIDDYYINILDWGSKNIISIALRNEVYLLNTETHQTKLLMSLPENNLITSLSFINSGNVLSIGTDYGEIQLYDIIKLEKIRTMSSNYGRISTLEWNNYILSSGGKDEKIINHDVRKKKHIISQLKGHSGEICSLKYNNDGILLASGGNDNLCLIWDVRNIYCKLNNISNYNDIYDHKPLITLNYHKAAVKAISWCPWLKNIIATGGGNKDKSIKLYNVDNNIMVNNINTGSQVCCLLWNKREKELISSHGFNKNQICIWNYPKMKKIIELKGHMKRVNYMAMSPDENYIVSASGDETLRIWKINEKINEISKDYEDDLSNLCNIR